jgi:hypothetical protein
MQLRPQDRLQLEMSLNEQTAGPISTQDASAWSIQALASCAYIGLQCSHCGDVRQALADFPAGETTLCPQCGTPCSFSRLGTGLTSRDLPFHEAALNGRQATKPVRETSDVAPRFRYREAGSSAHD